nr:MAG TPA: hypothetical protein [Bacteriophage sp.]
MLDTKETKVWELLYYPNKKWRFYHGRKKNQSKFRNC